MMRSVLPVLVFASLVVLIGCEQMMCDNEAPAEHLSPDGRWKYVSFDRNCGATTGSNLQISILPASSTLPNTAANAFIADDDHGATRFVAQPEWIGARKLKITYSPKARVFKQERKVGPIEIEYEREP